jgi:hypothetical protein
MYDSFAIGDDPMPAHELDFGIPTIRNGDVVSEYELPNLNRGFFGTVFGGDIDGNPLGSLMVHELAIPSKQRHSNRWATGGQQASASLLLLLELEGYPGLSPPNLPFGTDDRIIF